MFRVSFCLLILAALLAACTGSKPPVPPPGSRSEPVAAPLALPPPSTLAGRFEANGVAASGTRPGGNKSGSYIASDLFRAAEDFDSALPSQRVVANANGAVFAPDWPKTVPSPFSGLAFAMYSFQFKDYDGEPELHYLWNTEPVIPGNVYYGLANWQQDRWDWYQGQASDKTLLASLSPYQLFNGGMIVVVLKIGTGASELDALRFGSAPPLPVLSASRRLGVAAMDVDFDASESTDPDGSIVEYRWDPEGDGSFTQSSGSDPHLSFSYPDPGVYQAAVQAIDDSGIHNEASTAITVTDGLNFSFGSPLYSEEDATVIEGDDGKLFAFGTGYDPNIGGKSQAFALKVSQTQSADFYKTWGGSDYETVSDAALGPDGCIYCCGSTASMGEGGYDALIQKWTQDGQLVWAKTYGHVDATENLKALVIAGNAIYACGTYYYFPLTRDFALAIKIDLDGNLIWTSNLIGPVNCNFSSLAFFDQASPPAQALLLCGDYSPVINKFDAFYAKLDMNGNLVQALTWGIDGAAEVAPDIAVDNSQAVPVACMLLAKGGGIFNSFLTEPGGTPQELKDSNALNLYPYAIECGEPGVFSTVFTYNDQSQTIGDDLHLDIGIPFSILNTERFGGGGVSYYRAASLARFQGGHWVFCGLQTGGPATTNSASLSLEASAQGWTSVSPSNTNPVLFQHDQTTATTDIADASFNRSGGEGDVFFYVP